MTQPSERPCLQGLQLVGIQGEYPELCETLKGVVVNRLQEIVRQGENAEGTETDEIVGVQRHNEVVIEVQDTEVLQ